VVGGACGALYPYWSIGIRIPTNLLVIFTVKYLSTLRELQVHE